MILTKRYTWRFVCPTDVRAETGEGVIPRQMLISERQPGESVRTYCCPQRRVGPCFAQVPGLLCHYQDAVMLGDGTLALRCRST